MKSTETSPSAHVLKKSQAGGPRLSVLPGVINKVGAPSFAFLAKSLP
jgi:hypothetical protein